MEDADAIRNFIKDEISKQLGDNRDISSVVARGGELLSSIKNDALSYKTKYEIDINEISQKFNSSVETISMAVSDSLQKKLLEVEDEFKSSLKKNESDFIEIRNKVFSLLPNAAVESIAYSYKESTVRHDKDVARWNCFFIFSLLVIFSIPILIAEIAGIRIVMASAIDILNVILHSLPFEAPLIWLAIYAAKQGKKSKRLLEEYYHKYTTAMTFIGMQRNAYEQNAKYKGFSLESDNQKELNRKFIVSIFENPSLTLEKHVTADMPIEELLPLIEKVGPENVKLLLETLGKTAPQKA